MRNLKMVFFWRQFVSPRKWKFRIRHILTSIRNIEKYSEGLSFDDFKKNQEKIDAILRNFEIIGEASKAVPECNREKHPSIPWQELAGLRDILILRYDRVNLQIIWEAMKNELPLLNPQIEGLLAAEKELPLGFREPPRPFLKGSD